MDIPVVEAHVVNDSSAPIASAPAIGSQSSSSQALPEVLNEGGAREFLYHQGFPSGLQDAFLSALKQIPIRFFNIDDSGSMSQTDGKRIVSSTSSKKKALLSCSRWAELTDAMKFHVKFAREASAPSEFRLLNGAAPISIGYSDENEANRYASLMGILEGSPNGGTPLCHHIREVTAKIEAMAPELRRLGKKACLIIATDGQSSDGDIAAAMAPLKNLPVWVVVRLCTDEDNVVNYWNGVDEHLELNMDVLDDLVGEAQEVYEKNKWLTYGEQLQRLREFGCCLKELDLLDETKLSPDQVRHVCCVLYGGKLDDYPHPELDFKDFVAAVELRNRDVGKVWDPITQKDKYWIEKKDLIAAYGKGCIIS
eukprot:CAMPEP_0174962126 /NCGR_PEP_ID=MMETSP0004_2-20121128/4617_1 /TAXON_ID=420556 /ORGANISM="Ochromonas sp., Strain CCMP1393" /LENGTH=366 /DNA_ID=CAMNT_0016210637 /DNA_START=58 /DNA_END=1158 /DNA_ORIENTATION=+